MKVNIYAPKLKRETKSFVFLTERYADSCLNKKKVFKKVLTYEYNLCFNMS